jgi:hypothetical protein
MGGLPRFDIGESRAYDSDAGWRTRSERKRLALFAFLDPPGYQWRRIMGKTYDEIDSGLAEWIGRQKLFFVATAPLAADGMVNCSPKGLDSFAILGGKTVAYLDLTGSGVETVAHVQENGRIVVMFCALEGPAKIVRLHGKGRAVFPGDAEYAALQAHLPELPGTRSIVRIDVTRVSDSCGFGVPIYEFQSERDTLIAGAERKGPDSMRAYQAKYNRRSIDGLPGVPE